MHDTDFSCKEAFYFFPRQGWSDAVFYGHLLEGGVCGLCTLIRCLSPASPGRQRCLVGSAGAGRPWNASMRAWASGRCLASPETDRQLLFLFGGLRAGRLALPPVSA